MRHRVHFAMVQRGLAFQNLIEAANDLPDHRGKRLLDRLFLDAEDHNLC